MKKRKKTNLLKRNSGFIVGCVLVGGVSFFTSNLVMSDMLPDLLNVEETEGISYTAQTPVLAPEQTEKAVFETDPFTITSSGSVIKGVETELPGTKTENDIIDLPEQTSQENPSDSTEADASEGGETSVGTDQGENYEGAGQDYSGEENHQDSYYDDYSYGDGSYEGSNDSSYDDGYYGDGSYDNGYYDNGSYDDGYYDNGSYDDGYYDNGSYDNGSYDNGSYDNGYDNGYGNNSYDDGYNGGSGDNSYDDAYNSDPYYDMNIHVTETPDDVILWDICNRYIDWSELDYFTPEQIRLIRNEIFALHGLIFVSPDLQEYFSQKSWYVPRVTSEQFSYNHLNSYESANLQLILDYEAEMGNS